MTELFGYRSPGHPSLEICAATPATGVKLYARYRLSETMQNNNQVSVQKISFHINFGKTEGRGAETMLQLIMMKLLCING